jgi:bis(5'-nucleosidyl)-tetraphosphatase
MRSISPSKIEEGEERAAGFVLFRTHHQQRQYLLLRHQHGKHWAFPKGHIEFGEDEETTAVRELLEETGITELQFIQGFRDTSHYSFQRNAKRILKTVVYYLAETPCFTVALSDEHSEHRWLGFDDAAALLTYEESKRILRTAEDLLASRSNTRD